MRLLVASGIFPPDIGGPATYVPTIGRELVARGHHVRVITLGEAGARAAGEPFPFALTRVDRRTPLLVRIGRVAALLARAARGADLLYANGLFVECALAARLARRPLVAKVVGDEAWERCRRRGWTALDLDAFQRAPQGVRASALKALRAWSLRGAERVIVPSRYLWGLVVSWGLAPERCTVIYNAVDTAPAAHQTPRAHGARGGLQLIAVGRLAPWKGVDLVIGALRDLPDAALRVVGDGPCRAEWEALARRAGVAERVTFTGSVPVEALRALLARHDAVVLASRYEGLPHVLLEAMAVGVPVVATRVGGTPELVEDGRSGLLVEPTVPALRAALERLQRDPGLGQRLVRGGRDAIERRFGLEAMVLATEGTLLQAAGQGTRPQPVWGGAAEAAG